MMVRSKIKRCSNCLFTLASFFMVNSAAGYSSDFSTSAEIHMKGGTTSVFRFTMCLAYNLSTLANPPLIVLEHVAPSFIATATSTGKRISILEIENPSAPMITLPEWKGSVAGLLAAASAQSRFAFQFYPERNCIHIIDKDLVSNADWPLNDKAPVQIRGATSVGDLHSQLERYSGVDIRKAVPAAIARPVVFRVQQPNRTLLSAPVGMQLTTIRDCIDRLLLANALPERNLYAEIQAASDDSQPLTDGNLKSGKMKFVIFKINIGGCFE